MRRADRLFQIIRLLQQRRTATTAAHIAEKLSVSERTIYRDIRDLVGTGTPIDGEAGVGYRIRPGYDLPPLMFSRDELQALVLGVRIVRQVGDPGLASAADAILEKVGAVLPRNLKPLLADTHLFSTIGATNGPVQNAGLDAFTVARRALIDQRRLSISYADAAGAESSRTIRPLGVFFWGKTWTLAAWCELRADFRNFRLDRVSSARPIGKPFRDEPGKTLRDMLAKYGPDAVKLLD